MAKIRMGKGHPVHLYINRYYNAQQFPAWLPVKGATHANEYPYINGLFPVGEFTLNEQDRQHARALVQTMTSFAKNGLV